MKVTIYIRQENEQKWSEIRAKSDWVNDMLGGEQYGLSERIRKMVRDEVERQLDERQGY